MAILRVSLIKGFVASARERTPMALRGWRVMARFALGREAKAVLRCSCFRSRAGHGVSATLDSRRAHLRAFRRLGARTPSTGGRLGDRSGRAPRVAHLRMFDDGTAVGHHQMASKPGLYAFAAPIRRCKIAPWHSHRSSHSGIQTNGSTYPSRWRPTPAQDRATRQAVRG